ncbi:cellulose binding domain-containing protein [Herbivorax sp. ANBcel31]|uniref:cellulose binding domain-containing protein n=1 Tax=Herbivorax sp. ANBcel31 TaxID=3069754 RepID=UPI0027B0158C|nr:cellulose binding domain-containing protein [Herbivorax sp. ANBcel31]MDQ2085293.1 cellulose binding domain-containing protein [Herbivorax sp. ANBcel31]
MNKKIKVLFILVIFLFVHIIFQLDFDKLFASTEVLAEDDFKSGNWTGGFGWEDTWAYEGLSEIIDFDYYSPDYCMRLSGLNSRAQRTVDLSQYHNVTLSYYWSGSGFRGNDTAQVRIFDGQWHTVHVIRRQDATGQYNYSSIDLSEYNMTDDFIIQFETNMRRDTGSIYIDDIVITGIEEPEPTPTPPPGTPQVMVEMYNEDRSDTTNDIRINHRITNTGDEDISLDQLKVRYYYTIDTEAQQNYDCFWSSVGDSNVTGSFVEMEEYYHEADYYMELGFTEGAGVLSPGSDVVIFSRFHKTDWSDYYQTNDYSFNAVASDYVEWEKVTAYVNDEHIWGIEPIGDYYTPPPSPDTSHIIVEMYNHNREDTTNSIMPFYSITNVSDETINLRDLELRYYYTKEGNERENYSCYWSTVGNNRVTGDFIEMEETYPDADHYLSVGFTGGAGQLAPGDYIEVHQEFNKRDWSDYVQTNDYSFNPEATDYVEWEKVTGYINGELVWGIEPSLSPTPTPTPEPTPTPIPEIGEGTGLRGEYYNNIDFTDIQEIRIDSEVDFEWGNESPVPDIDEEEFSVRWKGKVMPKFSEEYIFYTYTDAGVRLWIDNVLIIDNWNFSGGESSGVISLSAGVKYDIRLEYFNDNDLSESKLSWESSTQLKEIIPQSQLYPPKIFTAVEHSVRTSENNFLTGDFIPLKIETDILWPISNPVLSIDLNIKKDDGSDSGFLIEEIRQGNDINKNYYDVFVNDVLLEDSDFTMWSGSRLNIEIHGNYDYGDQISIRYVVKSTATEEVFTTGIGNYLEENHLENTDLEIIYEISQWVDMGLLLDTPYSINDAENLDERESFIAPVRIEDPNIFQ